MILHIENPKDATRKLLDFINEFNTVGGYHMNAQKSIAFYTLTTKEQKEKLRNSPTYHHIRRNKLPRNKEGYLTSTAVQ